MQDIVNPGSVSVFCRKILPKEEVPSNYSEKELTTKCRYTQQYVKYVLCGASPCVQVPSSRVVPYLGSGFLLSVHVPAFKTFKAAEYVSDTLTLRREPLLYFSREAKMEPVPFPGHTFVLFRDANKNCVVRVQSYMEEYTIRSDVVEDPLSVVLRYESLSRGEEFTEADMEEWRFLTGASLDPALLGCVKAVVHRNVDGDERVESMRVEVKASPILNSTDTAIRHMLKGLAE